MQINILHMVPICIDLTLKDIKDEFLLLGDIWYQGFDIPTRYPIICSLYSHYLPVRSRKTTLTQSLHHDLPIENSIKQLIFIIFQGFSTIFPWVNEGPRCVTHRFPQVSPRARSESPGGRGSTTSLRGLRPLRGRSTSASRHHSRGRSSQSGSPEGSLGGNS